MKRLAIIPLCLCSLAAVTPPSLYTLRYLSCNAISGATNYTVYVSNTSHGTPWLVFSSTTNRWAISNLVEGATYYFNAAAWANGILSTNDVEFVLKQENYTVLTYQAAGAISGPWLDLPGTSLTFTNLAVPHQLWRLAIAESNNLSPYKQPQ